MYDQNFEGGAGWWMRGLTLGWWGVITESSRTTQNGGWLKAGIVRRGGGPPKKINRKL